MFNTSVYPYRYRGLGILKTFVYFFKGVAFIGFDRFLNTFVDFY